MKILLDECLPRKLMYRIAGHEVTTVVLAGWSGKKNGELLRLAASRFDVFVTADRNLSFQQVVSGLSLSVIVLVAPTNRLVDLVPLVPSLEAALGEVNLGEVRYVGTHALQVDSFGNVVCVRLEHILRPVPGLVSKAALQKLG